MCKRAAKSSSFPGPKRGYPSASSGQVFGRPNSCAGAAPRADYAITNIFFGGRYLVAQGVAVPGDACKPASARTQEIGCWILADNHVGQLTKPQVFHREWPLIIVRRAEPLSQFRAPIFAASAELASAKGRLTLRIGREPPADHLRQLPGFVNLVCLDAARYYNLPARRIVCLQKLCYRLGGSNGTMRLPIMADPNLLLIGDPKVDASDWALISPL